MRIGWLSTYDSLALLNIDLVSKNNLAMILADRGTFSILVTYERKVLGIARRSLNQELVSPAVESIETLGVVDIKHQHAAVGTSVECNAQRLEALLTSRVPKLGPSQHVCRAGRSALYMVAYLHRHLSVVNQDLSRQEIGTDRGFVAGAELLVDLYRSFHQYTAHV